MNSGNAISKISTVDQSVSESVVEMIFCEEPIASVLQEASSIHFNKLLFENTLVRIDGKNRFSGSLCSREGLYAVNLKNDWSGKADPASNSISLKIIGGVISRREAMELEIGDGIIFSHRMGHDL